MTDKLPSETFCLLPWVHLSTRPDGSMRVCCTANASSVGPTNDKEHGGQVGILKTDDGKPNNLNVSDFETAWNSNYMKNVRKQMLNGEKPTACSRCYELEDTADSWTLRKNSLQSFKNHLPYLTETKEYGVLAVYCIVTTPTVSIFVEIRNGNTILL